MNALYFILGLSLVLVIAYFVYKKTQQDEKKTDAETEAAEAVEEAAKRTNIQQQPINYVVPIVYYRRRYRRPYFVS